MVAYAEKHGLLNELLSASRQENPSAWRQFDSNKAWPAAVPLPTSDFGDNAGKQETVDRLVAYAEKHGLLSELVSAARKENPAPWKQFDADPKYPPRAAGA